MAVDKIKHTKPVSQRTFLDELEPIPYEISAEEIAAMEPRMREILFGIKPVDAELFAKLPPEINTSPTASSDLVPPAICGAEKPGDPEEAGEMPADNLRPERLLELRAEQETSIQELAEHFNLTDSPKPHVTLIFPLEKNAAKIAEFARNATKFQKQFIHDRPWFVARFCRCDAAILKEIIGLLGDCEDGVILFNGKRVPFGKSLWSPLMYIFTAGIVAE